mmetsp:Transcript_391/g.1133  ORF Transcript_391/g.1133 Transcript_391/m.1133 type:complete len:376 (+) Transcript_391:743-1870(+)
MHLVHAHGEVVSNALHGQVLPHRLHLLPEVDVLLLAALVAKLNQPAADPVDRLFEQRLGPDGARVGCGGEAEVLLLDGRARARHREVELDVASELAARLAARLLRRRRPPVRAGEVSALLEGEAGRLEAARPPGPLALLLARVRAGACVCVVCLARPPLARLAPLLLAAELRAGGCALLVAAGGEAGGGGEPELLLARGKGLSLPVVPPHVDRLDRLAEVLAHDAALEVAPALCEGALDPRAQRRRPRVARGGWRGCGGALGRERRCARGAEGRGSGGAAARPPPRHVELHLWNLCLWEPRNSRSAGGRRAVLLGSNFGLYVGRGGLERCLHVQLHRRHADALLCGRGWLLVLVLWTVLLRLLVRVWPHGLRRGA